MAVVKKQTHSYFIEYSASGIGCLLKLVEVVIIGQFSISRKFSMSPFFLSICEEQSMRRIKRLNFGDGIENSCLEEENPR